MTDQRAGNTRVDEMYITTYGGDVIDLYDTGFFMELQLNESIHFNCMQGSILLNDAANILVNSLIVGKDVITFKLRTPSFSDSPENLIYKSFYIHSVSDRKLNSDREQFYVLNFISMEGLKDSMIHLTNKFAGQTDEIALKIFEENLQTDRILAPDGEATGGITNFVVGDTPHKSKLEFISNHWSPFKCLNYIARNSVGNSFVMPSVLFFETNKGYYLTSITNLIQQQKDAKLLYDEYSYMINLDENPNEPVDFRKSGEYKYTSPFTSMRQLTVEKLYYPTYFDQLRNQSSGYYANTTFSYDWTTKDIYDIKFDYTDNHEDRQLKNLIPQTFGDFKHIGSTAPFPSKPYSNPLNNIKYKAGASNLFGDTLAFDIGQVSSVSFRNTAMAELEAVKLEITVPGKTDIEVGRLIRFNFPLVGEKTNTPDRTEAYDKLVSGIYLITGINHVLNRVGHTMLLEIVRDSFEEGE